MYGGEPGRREITDNHVLACDVSDASLNFKGTWLLLVVFQNKEKT